MDFIFFIFNFIFFMCFFLWPVVSWLCLDYSCAGNRFVLASFSFLTMLSPLYRLLTVVFVTLNRPCIDGCVFNPAGVFMVEGYFESHVPLHVS
jgi:hypothetical protein